MKHKRAHKRKINNKRGMTMVGINCNGLNSKWQSFDNIIHDLKPCAFFLQETKLPQKQQFKSDTMDYVIFRLEREKSGGGGIALGVIQDLNPILIRMGSDTTEAISVKINVNQFEIRLIVGYGAQENDRQASVHDMSQSERKQLLWDFLDLEIKEAENMKQGLVIQIDANAHLGPNIIKGDKNPMNSNGAIMKKFLEQNPAITVVNSLELSKGLITRRRDTIKGVEESVIDFFMVNERMLQYVTKMRVDEEEQYALSNLAQKKKTKKSINSDHRTLILELNIQFTKIKPDNIEFFNFKSESCQNKFKILSDNETNLVKCLNSELTLNTKANVWQKTLESVFHKSFTKIKVKNSKKKSNSTEAKLLEERKILLRHMARNPNDETATRISEIEDNLSQTNFEYATAHMKDQLNLAFRNDSTNGTKSAWTIYRKLRPRHKPVIPVGKKDMLGNIITNHTSLKKLYLETFVWRLRQRPAHPNMVEIHNAKEKMFKTVMKLCEMTPSKPWNMVNLEKVLKSLKKDKCRDPHGLVNELFFTNIAGAQLKTSLLILFNEIKKNQQIPQFMKIANISSIYKGKGSMNDLKNERGIFLVSIYRSILMKLLYNEKREIIDENMSDSQVGARKNKNIRNHTWILNGVINEVLKRKTNTPIDIQIVDVRQCFDSLWPEECLSDLFQYGMKDDGLALLYNGCSDITIKVKTPVGLTEEAKIDKTVMQGDVWGPSACSVSVDSIGKECIEEHKYLYHYKNKVSIPPLAMVDDLLSISECGPNSVKLNSYINYKISSKKLQFGAEKCKKLCIGKAHEEATCPELTIDGWKEIVVTEIKTGNSRLKDIYEGEDVMNTEDSEKYLGDIITNNGKNDKNIKARENRGRGITKDLLATIVEMLAGAQHHELGVTLRNAMLISSLLTNSESWYNVPSANIETLEKVDEHMLRGILKAPRMSPRALLYLELGCLPIRYIIKTRRLMFLHYILSQTEDSLIKKFFFAQLENSSKTDWTSQVQRDLEEIEIKLTFEEIQNMSKSQFKKLVTKNIENKALLYLKSQIKSKGKEIEYENIELQDYLRPEAKLKIKEKQDIFKMRSRMLEIKENVKGKYLNFKCDACKKVGKRKKETQKHVYRCSQLNSTKAIIGYNEIFGRNVSKQKQIITRMNKNIKTRNLIMKPIS